MRNTIILSLLSVLIMITSCSYVQKIRDGKTAHDRKQYVVAVELLNKEYKKAKRRIEKGKIAFYLAESYKEMNQSDKSIQWYQIAYDYSYGVDALKEKAYALKRAQRYAEAMEAFQNLGFEIGSPYEYRKELLACKVATEWEKDDRKEYQIELLEFNSGFADYAPILYEGNQLVFTSDRQASTGDDTYNWTGNDFSDFFLVDLNSRNVSSFDNQLNTEDNEGTITFNRDFTEVYFTRCFGAKKEDAYCKIMASEKQGNSWSVPESLPFVEQGINYGHPSLSEDGNYLYFSCNHPDNGWGGYDIYVSEKTSDGWGEPKVLSRSINTIGNEQFPVIDKDTLYFSSDTHIGMGGLDIFKSYRLSNGAWSPPYNLKDPINSGGDDFGLVVDYGATTTGDVIQTGYFSSTRNDGMGNDDIYRFEKVKLPPLPEPPEPEPEVVQYKMILNGYVLEKIYENPVDPNSKVLGRKPLDGAKVIIQTPAEKQTVVVEEDGFFSIELDKNTDYGFLASKENYLNKDAFFSSKGIGEDPNNPVQTFEIEIVLDKIFLDKEIVLENIYYDFDESFIREDAKPTLDELAKNLTLNPKIQIQLSSHTDCRGSNRYNEVLSQERAEAAVDYLISKGIEASRITPKGYGETIPSVDCACARCTEEEHQQNRRTTFKILEGI